jgi:hypothetical protein
MPYGLHFLPQVRALDLIDWIVSIEALADEMQSLPVGDAGL